MAEVVIKVKTFRTGIPISAETGPTLEHLGLLIYPHDRENCEGCQANEAHRKMWRAAVSEIARRADRLFLGTE